MYIAIYNEEKEHVTNIDNVTFERTERVYDFDNFSASGYSNMDINHSCFLILNDDAGNYEYACFVDTITPKSNARTIKGLDFRVLYQTEILLDYTEEGSFDGNLAAIFNKINELLFNTDDATVTKISVAVDIDNEATQIDTTPLFGTLQGQYKIVNAYTFLKGYLKYYEFNIESKYDVTTKTILFRFVKNNSSISINLSDFTYDLQTNSSETNKAVATVKYKPISQTNDNIHSITNLTTKYYYRTTDNEIVESDKYGDISSRIYPVRTKLFESEYLADAQYDAVYELANARYVDNIILDNNKIIGPINLDLPLYTKFNLYYNNKFYKTLPLSEKTIKVDANGNSTKIKLGFKKILLTEIIKAGGASK